MSMQLLFDSNYRATLRFGSQQLRPVFPERVQAAVRFAPHRVSLVSQIRYFMRTSLPPVKVALIFGSFENLLTGRRSAIQHFPMQVVREEVASYAQMVQDLLRAYANVSVYLLSPLYRSQPLWYESVYGETSNLFCSVLSRLDPARVKVVPPVDVSARSLDPHGVHFGDATHQLVVDQLISSFMNGVFVDPAHYPQADTIGYNLYPSSLILYPSRPWSYLFDFVFILLC
jgi:hypothetical protein